MIHLLVFPKIMKLWPLYGRSLNAQEIKETIHSSHHLTKPGPKTKYWTLTTASRWKTDLGIRESMLWLGPQTEILSPLTKYPRLKSAHSIPSKYLINCLSLLHPKWKWPVKKGKLTGFLCPLWLSILPWCTMKETNLWFMKAYNPILCSVKNISIE